MHWTFYFSTRSDEKQGTVGEDKTTVSTESEEIKSETTACNSDDVSFCINAVVIHATVWTERV